MSADSKRRRSYRTDNDGEAGAWKRRADPSVEEEENPPFCEPGRSDPPRIKCPWQEQCYPCVFLRNRLTEMAQERDKERRH